MTPSREAPLVSVVTPFHDSAKYLRKCIESVLGQSHDRFEYVLQDNASSDGSTEIALEYAGRDPRVRYFRLDELIPQIPNYNLALARISQDSKYCKIAQADDWLMPDCLRQMVELGEGAPSVGLISAYRFKGDSVAGEGLPCSTSVLSGREAARLHLLRPEFLFGSPTTVMYRSDVVRRRSPFFASNRLNEDTEACYEILRDWDFGYVHQILSHTRMDDDSILGRVRDKDPFILGRLINLRRYGPEYLEPAEFRARLGEVERRYYRCLARSKFLFREAGYWEFHRHWLAVDGLEIDRGALARSMGREALSVLASPRQLLAYAKAWRRGTPPEGH